MRQILTEWFINYFHVTYTELPDCWTMPFPVWKMLLRVFPSITADNILNGKLRRALLTSPIHIEYAMRNHGITLEKMVRLITELPPPLVEPYNETRLWARKCLPTPKKKKEGE
ncbi:hypothetical protein Pelo_19017 [Pelomyxa schiedti]|nr:hypothetical protein Pelo_19017 [Pelomyxa schiedti]